MEALYLTTAGLVVLCCLYRLLYRGSRPRRSAPAARPEASAVEVA
jgi:hypothetical protein